MVLILVAILCTAPLVSSNIEQSTAAYHGGNLSSSNNLFRHIEPYAAQPVHQTIGWRNQVALRNIFSVSNQVPTAQFNRSRRAAQSVRDLKPGEPAPPFQLTTLSGNIQYPSNLFKGKPIIIHTYDKRSGFLEALWNTPHSFDGLINGPPNAAYIFLSTAPGAYSEAQWMKKQIIKRMRDLSMSEDEIKAVMDRMHFATTPAYEMGNWMPDLLKEWRCEDHNCGYYQAVFQSENPNRVPLHMNMRDCLLFDPVCAQRANNHKQPIVLKRQDARYDWLPNMFVGLGPRTTGVIFAGSGCDKNTRVRNKIALLTDGGCSYFTKVANMQKSGSLGVIVVADEGAHIHDMNCNDQECTTVLSIPATMIPYEERLMTVARLGWNIQVRFQTTQSDNFYLGIDKKGRLQEMGWLLYPTFSFFGWQIEGMDFESDLEDRVIPADIVINVFNRTRMHGDAGAFAPNVKLPWDGNRVSFSRLTLDLQLDCPYDTDRTCAEWDMTVHLFVCCDDSSLCGMELGRWISPYRRRSGRWLTDASNLLPLLNDKKCNFTMKHPPWTDAWYPVLNLRFSDPLPWLRAQKGPSALYQDHIEPMFVGSETFDKTYNTKFSPFHFVVPQDVRRVTIYALITGHGSDNNNCAEFCVTSHNFLVNEATLNSRVFNNAGTPHGCAHRVKEGVVPNQHGTWLYGRNGWCPGENINPWVVDVTEQISIGAENTVRYFGHFNNSDPDPTSNPGNIIISAYLIFWKEQPAPNVFLKGSKQKHGY